MARTSGLWVGFIDLFSVSRSSTCWLVSTYHREFGNESSGGGAFGEYLSYTIFAAASFHRPAENLVQVGKNPRASYRIGAAS